MLRGQAKRLLLRPFEQTLTKPGVLLTGSITLALVAGGLATVNPCGFALLPAFLSFYVGADDERLSLPGARVAQGLVVGGAVAIGFLGVFLVAGIPISLGATGITRLIPWGGLAIGLLLVVLGAVALGGWHIGIEVSSSVHVQHDRSLRTMLLFGVGYGVASLGCTLPVFLAVLGASLATHSVTGLLTVFASYAAGTLVVLMALSIAAALLKDSLAKNLKRLLPYMSRIAGGLLLVAGAYLTYYWARVKFGDVATFNGDPVVRFVSSFTAAVERTAGGNGKFFILAACAIVAAALLSLLLRRRAEDRVLTQDSQELSGE